MSFYFFAIVTLLTRILIQDLRPWKGSQKPVRDIMAMEYVMFVAYGPLFLLTFILSYLGPFVS